VAGCFHADRAPGKHLRKIDFPRFSRVALNRQRVAGLGKVLSAVDRRRNVSTSRDCGFHARLPYLLVD